MKNLFFALSLVIGLSFAVHAEQRGLPRSVTGESIHQPGFTGVSLATSAFTVNTTTVTYSSQTVRGTYTVFGVSFSTGTCFNSVDLFASTETVASQGEPTLRVYNTVGSTGAITIPSGICAGYVPLGEPVTFEPGLLFKPSAATHNKIAVFYYKEGE